jgi:hypothetical protein
MVRSFSLAMSKALADVILLGIVTYSRVVERAKYVPTIVVSTNDPSHKVNRL